MQSVVRRLENGGVLTCAGVGQAAQPFFTVLLRDIFPGRPFVLVAPDLKTQESCQQDIETWLSLSRGSGVGSREQKSPGETGPRPSAPGSQPLFYPPWEVFPHEGKLPHADTISDRLQTLVTLTDHSALSTPHSALVVTSVTALLQKTFPPGDLQQRTRALHRGDKINPLDLIEWLEEQGYESEAQVTRKGEMALRGGILDVWPPTSPWPARLEFFGDELESLRHFDPLTQISREEIVTATVPPAGELGFLKQIQSEGRVTRAPDPGNGTRMARPSEVKALSTLLNYLPRETIFLLCDPERLSVRAGEYASQIPANDPFFISWPDFLGELGRGGFTSMELSDADGAPGTASAGTDAEARQPAGSVPGVPLFASLDAFRPLAGRAPEPQIAEAQRREFFNQLHRWLRQGFAVHVFCNNDGERQRFLEIWKEFGLDDKSIVSSQQSVAHAQEQAGVISNPLLTTNYQLLTHIGSLSRGFLCDDAKLVVVTDAEIFGRYKIQRPRRLKSPHALATRSALDIDFTELEEGDLVVHLQYGIGKFLGLKNLPATTKPSDPGLRTPDSGIECLVIEYAPANPGDEPPKLYVPVTEAHLVGKYVGAGKAHPSLNTLGGTRWQKAKVQAERAVRDVAADLLQIQAARETQPGHAFKPDAPWQREFESAFIFEETPDQWRAIQETKSDMEKPRPMDRLICGDVGFGKTEVAIRAAFKAVMGGKQVAVLVPTTVLAQQHFNVFRERMADYPVRIELLSRFRTRRAQQRVVKDLAGGSVDIVIGTHRLIQNDIIFKDLGLVVIDEEQRFGVLHKEKFKRLRTLVDVLTLSATPIPRTLYLALTGARDMSTIQTPPHDRLPVETIVTQFDERVIRDAIQRELNRGGQVFFLHNRVMTIQTMADRLKRLLPRARIVVGHGQMEADELEEVMTKFVNGEADVLLSTTIIESGLDIPNANTIIIDRADRFGLSDLYQLRGRVGRYKHQAYAYLLLPRHVSLLTDVRKRISAIRQYSTLGSGFKIAMRDLEIRGAGNLLGAEQSGHITAVGFELYCQLLKQSVSALKGEKVKPRVEVSVKLDFLEQSAVSSQPSVATGRGHSRRGEAPDEPGAVGSSGSRGRSPHHAGLPHNYISESQHRIEIYRKLAQATDKPALAALQKEMRDRFGPPPPPVELLWLVAELKILAAEKSITAIEVKDDKLMLTRHGDFITLGGKFPRLAKKDARARLNEIKRLLLAI
ncbi:MAG TPA: transcription-repair coupling factor [Verrucomicrobiae bacterium]|nr:transcription-repair coupling factor [Verrucomicrobiae bacterium]